MISVGFSRFWLTTLWLFACLSYGNLAYSQDKSTDQPIQTVIAEGVGSSQDEALKDAFRAAVRQVVGAVVDAETVVQNDEVIDDKVLTYSDGFIKKHDEVPGSKKVAGGLHRIKIKADVERRSVIAKLKAVNITVKEVDGKNMFADLITKEEGESNANNLIRKALSGFPSLLTATVQGKPEYDRAKSELVLKVDVAVDQEAYQQEVKRLEEVLSNIAISKESVVLKAEPAQINIKGQWQPEPSGTLYTIVARSGGPSLPNNDQKVWCLWVCSTTSGKMSNQKWNCYLLPGSAVEAFQPLLMPFCPQRAGTVFANIDTNADQPQRKNSGKTMVNLQFKNSMGGVLIEDEREITSDKMIGGFSGSPSYSRSPIIREMVLFEKTPRHIIQNEPFDEKKHVHHGFLAPYAFILQTRDVFVKEYKELYLDFATKRTMLFRVKATPEELKSIADVVCKVEYTPDPAMSK